MNHSQVYISNVKIPPSKQSSTNPTVIVKDFSPSEVMFKLAE